MFEGATEFFLGFYFFLVFIRVIVFSSLAVIFKPESRFKSNTKTEREDGGRKEEYSCNTFPAILNVM